MTHIFQPLDLTVNKAAKDVTRDKFSDWFTKQINLGLDKGLELNDIEVDYKLSVLKPLHAKWLISFYDYMSTVKGKDVIANGWKRSGIFDAIRLGSSQLPPLDPFNDICPMFGSLTMPTETLSIASLFPQELDCYRYRPNDDVESDVSDWEEESTIEQSTADSEPVHQNVFDLFN